MQREERYRAWLHDALRGSAARMGALLSAYESAQQVFEAACAGELACAGAKGKSVEAALMRAAREERIDALLEKYARGGIAVVSRASEDYPELLRQIYDPPEILYVKGKLRGVMRLPLALIGSRKCSEYGRQVAFDFGRDLAAAGACIISGLAYGLDVTAARGAMESGSEYPTVAVLGCGVDIPYPASNRAEYERIIECGAVVSEFLPGTHPIPAFFPQRNRIISGMSRGTLVVEAGEKSGAGITVDFALEQGRDVFAVPGRITDPNSAGTNRYIRDGYAKAVLSPNDVLCEYGIEQSAPAKAVDAASLPPEQALVCRLLQASERNFDELCALTAFPAARLNSILTVMEFSGIIRQTSGRMYRL